MHSIIGNTQRIFDRHAIGYDRLASRVMAPVYAKAAAEAARLAPPDGTVLDAGTGPGRLVIELATRRPDLTVLGMDISPDMVTTARRNVEAAGVAGRTRIERADVADLPLPTGSIDLIISTASFHHWADVPGAARELRRVIRPGGHILIYDLRFAPWRRLAAAVDAPLRRTGAGLFFSRCEVPVG